jgi:hypothetical protein
VRARIADLNFRYLLFSCFGGSISAWLRPMIVRTVCKPARSRPQSSAAILKHSAVVVLIFIEATIGSLAIVEVALKLSNHPVALPQLIAEPARIGAGRSH